MSFMEIEAGRAPYFILSACTATSARRPSVNSPVRLQLAVFFVSTKKKVHHGAKKAGKNYSKSNTGVVPKKKPKWIIIISPSF